MSKKYVPSGYQIISLDLTDKTSGTPFVPETEDEKILFEILSKPLDEQKPILFKIKGNDTNCMGFAISSGTTITLSGGEFGAQYNYAFYTVGSNLAFNYNEE